MTYPKLPLHHTPFKTVMQIVMHFLTTRTILRYHYIYGCEKIRFIVEWNYRLSMESVDTNVFHYIQPTIMKRGL